MKMIVTGSKIFGVGDAEYVVQEFIGSGSFGTVYKVQECETGKIFAVKTVSSPFPAGADLATFLNEGALAVKVRHRNVIEYEYFHDGARHKSLPPYILMQYADGGSWEGLLRQARSDQKPFSNDNLRKMFQQLASGMQAINAVLVHRDIKPANILIDKGVLKITDFGLAKVVVETTRTLTFKGGGTFPYMAPEAWRNDTNTIGLDVYALGIVFYELATLGHPFSLVSNDPQKWMEAHLYAAVLPPNAVNAAIETRLSQLIMRMIDKNAKQRISDWSKILELLEQGEPSSEQNKRLIEVMLQKRLEHDRQNKLPLRNGNERTRNVMSFAN